MPRPVRPACARRRPLARRARGVRLYALWSVCRPLRRHCGQGDWPTLARLAPVSLAYLAFLVLTMAGSFLVGALVA